MDVAANLRLNDIAHENMMMESAYICHGTLNRKKTLEHFFIYPLLL